jgi:hypothetical protein
MLYNVYLIKVTIDAIYETRLTSILDVTLDSTKMCNALFLMLMLLFFEILSSNNTKYCYLKKIKQEQRAKASW